MPKKSSSRPTPSTPSHNSPVPNRDVLQRLNFLHQAAHYLAITLDDRVLTTQQPASSSTVPRSNNLTPNKPFTTLDDQSTKPSSHHLSKQFKRASHRAKKKKQKYQRAKVDAQEKFKPMANLPMIGLSRTLSKTIKLVAKKAVVRMDPSVKRSICQSCSLLLIPGHTASTRVLSSGPHAHKVVTTCLACHHKRTIPHPPEHSPQEAPQTTGCATSTPDANFTQKRIRKEERMKRPVPFWRRDDHVVFAGTKRVSGGPDA